MAKSKKRKTSGNSVTSMLIRRPIQKWFPLFILPTFICFCIGFIWPFIQGIYLSFCNFNTPDDATFVGISNYVKALSDPGFVHAFWNTAAFAVVSIILINVAAFAIAYALTQKMWGANLFRTVFFMPNLIGGIILGYIWQLLLNGILIKLVGADLTFNSVYGYWGIILLYNWQKIGYLMIIYIAGIQSVPADMLEAAKIDGANYWQILRKIILPMVMSSITICTFLSLTDCFKMYDQNLALTGGAPANQTAMLALDITNTYYNRVGFAGIGQAKAVIFTLLVFVIALIQLRATRSKEVE